MAACPTTGWSTLASTDPSSCSTTTGSYCTAALNGQPSSLGECYDSRIARTLIAAKAASGVSVPFTLDERGDRFQFGFTSEPYQLAKAACAQSVKQVYRATRYEGPTCSWDDAAPRTSDRFCTRVAAAVDCPTKMRSLSSGGGSRFIECIRGSDLTKFQSQGGCWMNSPELWIQMLQCYDAADPGLGGCIAASFASSCPDLAVPSAPDPFQGSTYVSDDGTLCPVRDLILGICEATNRITPALTLTWDNYGPWVDDLTEYVAWYTADPESVSVQVYHDSSSRRQGYDPVSLRVTSSAADPIADLSAAASYVTQDPYIASTAGSYPRVAMYVPAEPEHTAAPGDISTGIMVPVTVGLLVLAIFIPKLLGQKFDFQVVRYATAIAFAIATVALASSRWAGETNGLYKAAGITAECMCSNPESMCPVDKHDLARAGQVFYVFASISLAVAVTVTIVAITGATKPTKLPSFVVSVADDFVRHPRAVPIAAIVSSVIGFILIGIYGGLMNECPLATPLLLGGAQFSVPSLGGPAAPSPPSPAASMLFKSNNFGILGGSWVVFLIALLIQFIIGIMILIPPLELLPPVAVPMEAWPRKLPYLILLLVLVFFQIFFGFIGLAAEDWSSVPPNLLSVSVRANPFHTCICAAPTSDMVKATAAFYIMYYIVTAFTVLAWVVTPAIVVIVSAIDAGAGETLDEPYVKVAGCLQPFTQRIVLLVRAIVVCAFLIIALIVYVFLPISEGYNQMALSQGYYLALTGAMLEMACLGWNIFGDHGDAAEASANAADACDDKTVEVLKQCDTADVDTAAANTTIEVRSMTDHES
jgi:small-conductance mechanosensitive channel